MNDSSSSASSEIAILYFDGVCNLCNAFVDFLIRRDRSGRLRFASLQGDTAKKNLAEELLSSLSTVVLVEENHTYTESGAAIRAIRRLGGIYKIFAVFLLVPPGLRDGIYRALAEHRYQWFGKRETCRLPTAEERERFLD